MTAPSQTVADLVAEYAAVAPDAVELATRVSLAVWVEPELLRCARLGLSPRLDAAAEADVWFSPLVEGRTARALYLHTEVAQYLRQRLAKNKVRLEAAWRVLERVHHDAPADIHLEEEVTWLSLRREAGDLETIEDRLMSVATAMVEQQRDRLARWAARALPLLPEEVQELEAARLLAAGAYARLGDTNALSLRLASGALPKGLAWVLPRQLPSTQVGVRLLDGVLELGGSGANGSTTVELLALRSRVDVTWDTTSGPRTESVTVEPNGVQHMQLGKAPITLRTAHSE
jgi:hypothetical protein